jgi:predicted ferric reductase
VKKVILFAVFATNIVVILAIWWSGSSVFILSGATESVVIALGRLFGLFAMLSILTQLVLIGRISWIEQEFGHDKMNRIHRLLGYSVAFFFLFHPLFLIWGYGARNEVSFWRQFTSFLTDWEHVLLAFISFLIFAGIITISLPAVRRKLKYEHWYFTHLLIYVAIGLSFAHQIETADVSQGPALYYWVFLNILVGLVYVAYRFGRPLYRFRKHRFTIEKVVPETHDVSSVYISGRNMDSFKFKAGQFANYTFLQKGMWYTHPFSFSSDWNGKNIRISVKNVGDFTSQIPTLTPGTKVIIDGPLGVFTEKKAVKDKYLFIAGGIGITPFRSLIESLSKKEKDIVLLYGNKTPEDIVFENELKNFPHKSHVVLSHVTSDNVENKFEVGRIDEEKINKFVPDVRDREIYICGPVPMMNSVLSILEKLGIPSGQIHYERFGYL